ncbi:unnamed protein product [Caretta caretta]
MVPSALGVKRNSPQGKCAQPRYARARTPRSRSPKLSPRARAGSPEAPDPRRPPEGGCFPGRASISLYRSVDLSLLKESKSEWRCLGLIAGDEWSLSAAQERAAVQTGSDILLELGVTPICLEQTRVKYFQDMFHFLGQDWSDVVYDEAIYCKAQLMKWRNQNEFNNDHLEMGGMYCAANAMGDRGSVMQESGLEDICVEANIYGASVISRALRGKACICGVRIHKLMNETMNHFEVDGTWQFHEQGCSPRCDEKHLGESLTMH